MEKKLRILHCVSDEKFIDSLIDLTQALWTGCCHEYVFIHKYPDLEFKYIHKQEVIKRFRRRQINDYIKNNKIDVVIIHDLYSIACYELVDIPVGVKVVWFAWGHDIYKPTYQILRPLIKRDLYYPLTKKALENNKGAWLYIFHQVLNAVKNSRYYWVMKKAISRIDYFSGVIPEEYDLIVADKHNSHFKAAPLLFNYGSLLSCFKVENIKQPSVKGYDIMVGNSGDPTNNHIDMMERLRLMNLGDKKIISPISYAGPAHYVKKVKEYGEIYFKDKFYPLTTFIPLKEYSDILASTRYAIFAMERQQAMANVFDGLWKGRMVFLSETNPAYISLKKNGYILYTIQHDLERIERSEVMKEEDVLINRKLLIKYYSVDTELKKAHDIIKTLKE